jgi:hypothetical protein
MRLHLAWIAVWWWLVSPGPGDSGAAPRHYAANGNFDAAAQYAPLRAGFNLADASTPKEVDGLPAGVLGLAWINRCAGVTDEFKAHIESFAKSPKLFGFYLMDDPDPSGRWRSPCPAANLRAESDFIHARLPNARTFVALMNIGDARRPAFAKDYAPARSHIDLFSIAAYPCRLHSGGCDFDMIERYVFAAEQAGVPRSRIVPTYQTFGGGGWRPTDGEGDYRLPSADELEIIIQRWKALVSTPEMDFAYSWGKQRGDEALEAAPDLQQVFIRHNK